MSVAQAADHATQRWVEMFSDGWRDPVDADHFADHFEPWLDPEIRMVQPQVPTLVGHRAFRERFARPLFDLVPDLRGTVDAWAASGERVYIELRLQGTVSGRAVELATCDRITLRDGLAVERIAYLDPLPLLGAVARAPRLWPRLARERIADLRAGS